MTAESLVKGKCSVIIWLLVGKGERNITHNVHFLCAEFSAILLFKSYSNPMKETFPHSPSLSSSTPYLYYYHLIDEETEVQRRGSDLPTVTQPVRG